MNETGVQASRWERHARKPGVQTGSRWVKEAKGGARARFPPSDRQTLAM